MNSILPHISDLKKKISSLVAAYTELTQEKLNLQRDKVNLEERVENLEQKLIDLKKRVEVVDVIQGIDLKDGESIAFARKRVNNLIRDIDKCIALLND